ncbi:hypothetical protein C8R43DRAFT_948547 [Mycena crocata]|nr:hypothetical protein C8R43DRAFT_948547 [Mycena crocata]
MGDAEKIASRLADARHKPQQNCTCLDCVDDRAFLKCKHPHNCAKMAQSKLDGLQRKWDPRMPDINAEDNPTGDPETEAVFTWPKQIGNLTDGFRVFTKEVRRPIVRPPPAPKTARASTDNKEIVYIGSAVRKGGEAEAVATAGIWYGPEDEGNEGVAIPSGLDQSRSCTEIIVALHPSREFTAETEIQIVSRKNTAIRAVTKNLPSWEDKGWIGVPHKDETRALVGALRSRSAKTTIAVVEESENTAKAITLARDVISATRTIHRKETDSITDEIQTAVKATYGKKPTPTTIWKSIRHPDISRQMRNFLWKTLHGANRLGKKWRHIPDMEDRETCSHCGVEETMEHILLDCESPRQSEIWALAKKMWLLAHENWPQLSFGLVLGCALAVFKTEHGKPAPESARLRVLKWSFRHLTHCFSHLFRH